MKTAWPIKVAPPKPEKYLQPEKNETPSVQLWGNPAGDCLVIEQMLKTLATSKSYHGDLQVMLSAVRRQERCLVELIERVQDGRG